MNPTPPDWPRFSSCVVYKDATAAITWLGQAFGFEVRLRVEGEGGRIEHCEMEFGDGLIMLAQEDAAAARPWKRLMRGPASLDGATTQSVMFFVDDARTHCEHARSAGARIIEEPETHDYGDDYWADLSYGALDPEGHVWWVVQRLRNPPGPIPVLAQK